LATRHTDMGKSNRDGIHVFVLLLAAILLLQILAGCSDSSPQTKQTTSKTVYGPVAPIPTLAPSALHGPTNFLLRTPLTFSSVSGTSTDTTGATTPIDTKTIKTGITDEMGRLLFVANSHNNVNVYLPGVTSSVNAQVTQRPDGSTAIAYTHKASSVAILFAAALYKDQIIVKYEQQYTPLITENASASDVIVAFTTHVRWVSANQVPMAPDNGQYQLMKDGSVTLSWDAGHNAVAYHIYRMFPAQDQQFQLLSTVKNTTYSDRSAQSPTKLLTMGIAYAIFSVGSTGIENPIDTIISLPAPPTPTP
jgi:hypothetical protein